MGTQRVPAILMGFAHTPLGIAILLPAAKALSPTASKASCYACGEGVDSTVGGKEAGDLKGRPYNAGDYFASGFCME